MKTQEPIVQRYRRTDQDRLGEWAPVGSTWKSPASAGLVSHDIYHHLPSDRGNFAQEVASLGAEWYVDIEPLAGEWPLAPGSRGYSTLERNARDSLLNALDSREKRPFALPARSVNPLGARDMAFFRTIAGELARMLEGSKDGRALDCESFEERFVQNLLFGYEQARTRFPNQRAARSGSADLKATLADLEQSEVPYGHEVRISLAGYDCEVTYDDADADYLREHDVLPAMLMTWCTCSDGYPAEHVTLHRDATEYAEYVADHFRRQDEQELEARLQLIPQGEQHELSKVYVRDAALREQLSAGTAVVLPLSLMRMSDYTPRGVRVI